MWFAPVECILQPHQDFDDGPGQASMRSRTHAHENVENIEKQTQVRILSDHLGVIWSSPGKQTLMSHREASICEEPFARHSNALANLTQGSQKPNTNGEISQNLQAVHNAVRSQFWKLKSTHKPA